MKTSLFLNNRTQAVRIPKPVAFPDSVASVEIVALGQARLIVPGGLSWDSFFAGPRATDDFMPDRVPATPRPGTGDGSSGGDGG